MRRIYVKRTEHVDNATGEVTHREESSSFFVKSRHFVKFFLDQAHLLAELSGGARSVLDIMLSEMEFNSNSIYIGKLDRQELARILQKSEHTIRNYLYEMENADVIAKTGSNVYKINPNIFQKGGDYAPSDRDRPIGRKNKNSSGSPL